MVISYINVHPCFPKFGMSRDVYNDIEITPTTKTFHSLEA